MADPTRRTLFKTVAPRAQTLMDKISHAAMEIVNEETKQREIKTERLRKTRLEREKSGVGEKVASAKRGRAQKR